MNNTRIAQAATVIVSEMRPEGGYKPNTQYLMTLVFQSTDNGDGEPVIDYVIAPPEEIKT